MKSRKFLHLAFFLPGNLLLMPVTGRMIPDSLKAFYDQVKDGSCPTILKKGLSKDSSNDGGFRYCSNDDGTLMWVAGPSSLADMDVDCDGANNAQGRCVNDPTGQSITAFQEEVSGFGIEDLDANLHSYVVLGTRKFDPQDVGVESLSIVAVVCNNQLFYGVWGDMNAENLVGEASISLATACFGSYISGDSGYSETDILYLAFRGHRAKPDSTVNWSAKSFGEFEESLAYIGDGLLSNFLQGDNNNVGSDHDNGANTGNGGDSSSDGTSDVGIRIPTPNFGLILALLALSPFVVYLNT